MSTADAIRITQGSEAQRVSSGIIPPAGHLGRVTDADRGYLLVGDAAKQWGQMTAADSIGVLASRIMRIADLSALTSGTVANDDVLWIWDTSDGAPKKISKSDLVAAIAGGAPLYEAAPDVTYVNSANDNVMFDFVVPGGTLTANGQSITGVVDLVVTNNSGSLQYLLPTGKINTVISAQDSTTSYGTSASPRYCVLTARMFRRTSTTGAISLDLMLSSNGVVTDKVAAGDLGVNNTIRSTLLGVEPTGQTLNWASDINFTLSIRFTSAHANLSMVHKTTRITR